MLRTLLVIGFFLAALLPPAAADVPASVDLLPLKKALAPLGADGTLQTHSTIRAVGSQSGLSVVLREDLQIVALRPGRFQARVTQFDAQGRPQKHLIVTSNGKSVWTYRPELKRYSVSTFAAFESADSDVPILGLIVGGFYLGEGYAMVQGFHSITPSNSADVLKALGGIDVALSEHAASFGGQDDYVYRMVLAKEKMEYQFYVSSETNELKRVDLTSTQDGFQIMFREDILQAAPGPAPKKSIFSFSPPPGADQSPVISTHPF